MKNRLLLLFILVILVQLFVPAKMIWDSEQVIRQGKTLLFKTAPYDPNDPFRGKFIRLRLEADQFPIEDEPDWSSGELVYVVLKNDEDGFVAIEKLLKKPPTNGEDFVQANISYIRRGEQRKAVIDYPFVKFYMKETKALAAEKYFNKMIRDSTTVAYAKVKVREGNAVLEDVFVNGTSLREVDYESMDLD